MAQNVLAGLTAKMLKEYPGLSVNLVTGIPAPDLIADGLDVVIRVGALQDSSLFSRRLGAMPMVVCAAKSYLTQYGIPEKPADLSSHSWLEYSVRPDNEFELCTVVDDGTMVDRRGSVAIDDEGTPGQYNVLIENGILKGYMQDKLNARFMGMTPTGNGRRESYAHLPMPRMTNTYMLPGKSTPQEIIESVEYGIYAPNFGGGQVDITSGKFVFSTS
ncbi:metallopeptidase TldD-related protein, partial [Bacillus cereus]|uniref:metallopeptidase TldD-related protein n=1 Tax=Bacillus cereus TaxID=1396 RepID=UPI002549D628